MIDGFLQSTFFGITLTLAAYILGGFVFRKTKHPLCTPIMIAVIVIIAVLKIFRIPYEYYAKGSEIIGLFLGPATACLAVNIYEKRLLLKKWWIPVLCGCLAGTLTSITSVLIICRIFGLSPAVTVALLPKSVTTPIAAAISGAQGGIVPITVAAVIVTGLLGNLIGAPMIKLFRIKEPVAAGLGLGVCAHGVGTARALAIGETEGAMAGIAIGVCGVITAVLSLAFPYLV